MGREERPAGGRGAGWLMQRTATPSPGHTRRYRADERVQARLDPIRFETERVQVACMRRADW